MASPNKPATSISVKAPSTVGSSPTAATALSQTFTTPTALLTRRSGTSFQAAFPQLAGNTADVLTISNGSVVFRIDANGVAHTNS